MFWEKKKQEAIEKLKDQYDRKKQNNESKINKLYKTKLNNEKRKIKWKEVKETRSIKAIKKKAFHEFQRAMVELNQSDWKVFVFDKLTWVDVNKAVWWHIYSKFNYPHLAFDENNCRPITNYTNRIQWTLCWLDIRPEVKRKLWHNGVDNLKRKAENKELEQEYIKLQRNYWYRDNKYLFWARFRENIKK